MINKFKKKVQKANNEGLLKGVHRITNDSFGVLAIKDYFKRQANSRKPLSNLRR